MMHGWPLAWPWLALGLALAGPGLALGWPLAGPGPWLALGWPWPLAWPLAGPWPGPWLALGLALGWPLAWPLAGPWPGPGWPLAWPWLALGLALAGPATSQGPSVYHAFFGCKEFTKRLIRSPILDGPHDFSTDQNVRLYRNNGHLRGPWTKNWTFEGVTP